MSVNPCLLVTDDDRAFRSVLCESLQRRGFDVTQASDGDEAISVLGSQEIHLALVDYQMPRVTGLEVMQHVLECSLPVPCVLMTAQLDETVRKSAMNLNAYQVLSKPVRLNELAGVVGKALREAWGWSPQT
jgi:CheY-like chemotaxis protein